MEVWPGGVSGVTDEAELFALCHVLADAHVDLREVRVHGHHTMVMGDRNELPKAVVPTGESHAAGT